MSVFILTYFDFKKLYVSCGSLYECIADRKQTFPFCNLLHKYFRLESMSYVINYNKYNDVQDSLTSLVSPSDEDIFFLVFWFDLH